MKYCLNFRPAKEYEATMPEYFERVEFPTLKDCIKDIKQSLNADKNFWKRFFKQEKIGFIYIHRLSFEDKKWVWNGTLLAMPIKAFIKKYKVKIDWK